MVLVDDMLMALLLSGVVVSMSWDIVRDIIKMVRT